MTEQPAAAMGMAPARAVRLEPDAIGVVQDTVIGMVSSAPGGDHRAVAGVTGVHDRVRRDSAPA